MLPFLIIPLQLVFGAFLGMVRDEDWIGPTKPANGGGNPFKEIGVGIVGLPFGVLIAWHFGWTVESMTAGALAAAFTSFAWSLQHAVTSYVTRRPEHALEADNLEALLNMAIGGALVALGPAAALWWFDETFLACMALLAGAAKAGTYRLAWRLRPDPHRKPKATFIGHVAHGALVQAGVAAAILLAG